jgi:rsbT co-antagonist protein RsbR
VSEKIGLEVLTALLEKLPGVFWVAKMEPTTGKSEWIHFGQRMAELYGVTPEEVRGDPNDIMKNVVPEDRASLQQGIATSLETLAPIRWAGRVDVGNGKVRWIESHTNLERQPDGKILWWGQAFDITERKKTEQALADSEAARAASEDLYRKVIDSLPVGVMVANTKNEFVIMNPKHQSFLGGQVTHDDGDITAAYGIFMADGKTPLPMENSGLVRAQRGELLEEEVVVRNPRIANDLRMHVAWTPLRDEHGKQYASLGTTVDVTMQRQLENELRTRNEQLAASEEAKTELIDRLRRAVDELSNPILEVWDGVLAMPIIGIVDSRRTADMVQRLLAEVLRMQASFVIIDLTGVDIVDTKTADHLMKLMKKVEVVGARCVLTGIRPAVAETLVDIGVDFGRLATLRNLKHGLGEALRMARRERETWRDYEDDDRTDDRERKRGRAGAAP